MGKQIDVNELERRLIAAEFQNIKPAFDKSTAAWTWKGRSYINFWTCLVDVTDPLFPEDTEY